MDNQTLNIRPRSGYGFIYCYTSPSGKKYIGQTKTTLKERAKKNAKGYKGCKYFYRAIEKYGWDNFEVEILQEVPYDQLDIIEYEMMEKYHTFDREYGYNIITSFQEHLAFLSRVPVYGYDGQTGEYIEEFSSISEAERSKGVYRGSIQRVVNISDRRTANLFWRTIKVDRIEIPEMNAQKTSIKIYMYESKTGIFVKEFSSIREATRESGYDRSTIQNHIRKKIISKKFYTFRDFKVDNLFNESSTTIS